MLLPATNTPIYLSRSRNKSVLLLPGAWAQVMGTGCPTLGHVLALYLLSLAPNLSLGCCCFHSALVRGEWGRKGLGISVAWG